MLWFCTLALAKSSSRGITLSGADFAAQTFDYIIIGGGTAGLALAARYVPCFVTSTFGSGYLTDTDFLRTLRLWLA